MASDADEGGDGFSSDDGFDEDMEALRRACFLSGTDPHSSSAAAAESDDEEDDLELVRGIRQRFNACCSDEPPLTLKPLSVLLPSADGDGDDDEDDFALLSSIQKRFARYDQDVQENSSEKQEPVRSKNTYSEKKGTPDNTEPNKTNAPKSVPDSLDINTTSDNLETVDITDTFSSCLSEEHEIHERFETEINDSVLISTEGCDFPQAAQMFVEAIRKNRACQKFIRNKMMQMEARIEENKKLQHRVKLLRGFQIKCKKETSRALSTKQDARYQLISAVKRKGKSKADGEDSDLFSGPAENSQVACYKMVLGEYRMSLSRKKWRDEERKNLAKGIKQQFQELLLQRSVDSISDMEDDSNDIDGIYASIRERDITPENMRLFLPKVNWERLASIYLRGRSGAECQARWLNWEDPLINHKPWCSKEDKKLLHIVQQRGISNWIEIAVLLETNRTPFQCLARYQRSLNASVLRSEWTKEEDKKLCAAVEVFGESSWENVAATLVGRTGPQCSNRWIKSLNPAREKIGRWSLDEDKRIKVAVLFFGSKNWKKVAQFVPGRTHVQCRERWVNNLDPSLRMGEWTEEEDTKLKEAIEEYGYCWTKVAACVASRTDNQCTRRWKALFPKDVPVLRAARKLQKAALISNFVDREKERPALGPNDFIPLALTNADSESGELNPPGKQSKKPRSKKAAKKAQNSTNKIDKVAGGKTKSKKKSTRGRMIKAASEETESERVGEEILLLDGKRKKKRTARTQKMSSRSKNAAKEAQADETLLTKRVDVDKVAGKKIKSKKKSRRRMKDKEASEATEGARIGQEIVTFDVETKKKSTRIRKMTSRYEYYTKESEIVTDEVPLTYGIDIEEAAAEKPNSKKNPTQQHKKSKETSKSTDARVVQEIFDGTKKKKKTSRKQNMPASEAPKEKEKVASSDRLPQPQVKKIIGPTNSRVSTCGESEVITMTTVEEVGEKNINSPKLGRKKNEQCKRFDQAASSFGENETFSEVRRLSSPHLEQNWQADPTEVNSSPCPNLISSRINNVNGKRKKGSVISRSSRIKCRALLQEASDVTGISDSETLGSIILKKKEMKRSLKMRSGLNHSSVKSDSIIDKEVDAVDEGELISEISRACKKIKKSAREHSCGERKERKPREQKNENAELGKKLSEVDYGAHRGEKRKRSRIDGQLGNGHEVEEEEGDDMTLASLFKKRQKKRRINNAPKTPPLEDVHIIQEAGDSDTCSPPPGFEKPVYMTGHLVDL